MSRFFIAILLLLTAPASVLAQGSPTIPVEPRLAGFRTGTAEVAPGVRIHYRVGGRGEPVVLLHGFAQTGHAWRPVARELARTHTVIVPDLRGIGGSSKPASGYDKVTLARDIHALTGRLGHRRVSLVGHDIGLMVAYAYAAQWPDEVERLVLMDAPLPGVGDWNAIWTNPRRWHFHFHGEVPLKLVTGRERVWLDRFWTGFSANPAAISESDRRLYTAAYSQPGSMAAAMSFFATFDQDAEAFTRFAATPLRMPVLTIAGERGMGTVLGEQARLVATNLRSIVVEGSGHWLVEEKPDAVIPALRAFLDDRSPLERAR